MVRRREDEVEDGRALEAIEPGKREKEREACK
jgi:hypothetical protein